VHAKVPSPDGLATGAAVQMGQLPVVASVFLPASRHFIVNGYMGRETLVVAHMQHEKRL
jgi:hypothetical protein